MAIQTGDILAGRYRIEDRLGKGGIARTFAAERMHDGRRVVVKELRFAQLESWKPYDLFQREVRVLRQLDHPGIPHCLEAFEQETGPEVCCYLVLERVPGRTLAEKLSEGWRPDEGQVVQLAIGILDLLGYLHGLAPPVIHRDLKPSNLMLDGERLWLVDFGAVQDALRPEGSSTVIGTFGYMAPEQLTGRTLPQSDLYALGATLVTVLSGRTPAELPQRELRLDFAAYVHVSPALQVWLEKLLEPAWERRFASAAEARRALLAPAPPVQPPPAMRKPPGTRVELIHESDSLYIRIPPGNFTPQTIYMTFFSVIWLSFVGFWTLLAWRGGLIFALFSVPFWLVGLGMARSVVQNLFLDTVLELRPEGFSLRSSRFGSLLNKGGAGELADITSVAQSLRYRLNNHPVTALGIEAGTHSHYFGTHLSRSEQLWLQTEILAYLSRRLPPGEARRLLALSEARHQPFVSL